MRSDVDRLRDDVVRARSDPLVPAVDWQQLRDSYHEARAKYSKVYSCQKALSEQQANEELEALRAGGNSRQFWVRLKQRRGFFEARDTPTVVQDEKGRLCVGAEAANVWKRLFERVGTVRDDAEEAIQQSHPLDEQFRQSVVAQLKQQLESLQADPAG